MVMQQRDRRYPRDAFSPRYADKGNRRRNLDRIVSREVW